MSMSVRTAAIASLFALVACAEPTTVIGAPCPCLDGYICCVPLGQCLTEGELCPIERPPLSCDLVDAADGSSTIQCSDGSSYPGQGPTPQCGTREVPWCWRGTW